MVLNFFISVDVAPFKGESWVPYIRKFLLTSLNPYFRIRSIIYEGQSSDKINFWAEEVEKDAMLRGELHD